MGAAAAALVWATLLMCVALGAGQLPVRNPLFPSGSQPMPVRIYIQQKAALNVAIRDGSVVLAHGDCTDFSQKWLLVPSPTSSSGPTELQPFALQNAQMHQVITIPSGGGQKVGLSSSPPINGNPVDLKSWSEAALKQRWTPEKPTRADRFYKLFVTNNPTLSLSGLMGTVQDGTDVGIFSASPTSGNKLWQITSYPACAR